MPGRSSAVGVAGCKGKAVGVSVGGNQMMVAVGVALARGVGVGEGITAAPEQAARINPQAARIGIGAKFRFVGMVSFIVSNTGRIFA
jgi:hypothetical protein